MCSNEEQRVELIPIVEARKTPQAEAIKARAVLLKAEGCYDQEVGRQVGFSNATAGKWRQPYAADSGDQADEGHHALEHPGRRIGDELSRLAPSSEQALRIHFSLDGLFLSSSRGQPFGDTAASPLQILLS